MSDNVTRLPTVQERRNQNHMVLIRELDNSKEELKGILPAHIPVERFTRVVKTAINQNPDILEASPRSVFAECQKAAADGLLPDGRDGALVIFNNKVRVPGGKDYWEKQVRWMVMIGGLRKKVRNSGEIKTWQVEVVYENDDFEYQLGDEPYIKHKPFLGGDRGKIIAAYSVATFNTGEKSREVMSKMEIDAVMKVSKSGTNGPWGPWYSEMARKTVARRHSKVLPMSTDLDDLIRRDDELYDLTGASDAETQKPRISTAGGTIGSKFDMIADQRTEDDQNGEVIDAETGEITQGGPPPADENNGDVGYGYDPADDQQPEQQPTAKDQRVTVASAYEMGIEARAKNASRKDMPKTFREEGNEDLHDAWLAGLQGKELTTQE